MKIEAMLKRSVYHHRNKELHSRIKYLPALRLKNAYVQLDIVLAKLASKMGWFSIGASVNKKGLQKPLLLIYLQGIDYYLLLANLKNWNQAVLVSASETKKLQACKPSKDLSQLYLAIKNMLYNSYFNHRQSDFMYSWKLYLKLGFSDLGLAPQKIEKAFVNRYHF